MVKEPPEVKVNAALENVQFPALMATVPVTEKLPAPLMIPFCQIKSPPMVKFPGPVTVAVGLVVPLMSDMMPLTVKFEFSVNPALLFTVKVGTVMAVFRLTIRPVMINSLEIVVPALKSTAFTFPEFTQKTPAPLTDVLVKVCAPVEFTISSLPAAIVKFAPLCDEEVLPEM